MITKNPDFGNILSLDTGIKIRRSLGGDLLTVRDLQWPIIEEATFTVSNLSAEIKDTLVDYFIQNAGQIVTFQDHEGYNWSGVVKTNTLSFTQVGRGCRWQIQIPFIGRRSNFPA